jgi:hypothetical protein
VEELIKEIEFKFLRVPADCITQFVPPFEVRITEPPEPASHPVRLFMKIREFHWTLLIPLYAVFHELPPFVVP